MTIPIKRCLVILTICQALAAQGHIAAAQQAEAQTDHAARIKALSEQLRWHDEAGREQYEAARDNLTQSVLQEIDSYVAESFNPGSTSADQVRDGIDALWGHYPLARHIEEHIDLC